MAKRHPNSSQPIFLWAFKLPQTGHLSHCIVWTITERRELWTAFQLRCLLHPTLAKQILSEHLLLRGRCSSGLQSVTVGCLLRLSNSCFSHVMTYAHLPILKGAIALQYAPDSQTWSSRLLPSVLGALSLPPVTAIRSIVCITKDSSLLDGVSHDHNIAKRRDMQNPSHKPALTWTVGIVLIKMAHHRETSFRTRTYNF